ncbi:6595_t:CDS:1, partial [Gigaspora rosea]
SEGNAHLPEQTPIRGINNPVQISEPLHDELAGAYTDHHTNAYSPT